MDSRTQNRVVFVVVFFGCLIVMSGIAVATFGTAQNFAHWTQQVTFGLIGGVTGLFIIQGIEDLWKSAAHRESKLRYLGAIRLGVAGLILEEELRVLGTPELPLADWHVLLIIACGVSVIYGKWNLGDDSWI